MCAVLCFAVQMNVSDVESELQKALQLQSSTSAALAQAVQDKLKAEAELKAAMVSICAKFKRRVSLCSAMHELL